MSLSERTGPFFGRAQPVDFKNQGLKPPPLPSSRRHLFCLVVSLTRRAEWIVSQISSIVSSGLRPCHGGSQICP
jgi:hypothetical protein